MFYLYVFDSQDYKKTSLNKIYILGNLCRIGEKMNKIDEFFEKKLITNNNTKRTYRRGIELYFQTINKEPDSYFNNNTNYEQDISKFYMSIEKIPPMSRKNRINAVRQFLSIFDRETKNLEIWDTISYRLRGCQAITEEKSLDQGDLQKIFQYGDIGARAMFLMMATSGCRIGEVVNLLPEDIRTNEIPTRVVFRADITKNKRMRTSFISDEATKSYLAWMNIRDNYLRNAVKKSTKYDKNPDDKRVFPMTDVNARLIWEKMVSRAGKPYNERDVKTGRLKSHPHSLRKFFRSYFGNADLAEHLMGHSGYLSTYRDYNEKQLGKKYLKYMENVTIFEIPADLTNVTKEINELKKDKMMMKQEIHELRNLIGELGNKKLDQLKRIEKN